VAPEAAEMEEELVLAGEEGAPATSVRVFVG
jgi:hypothetical protein